MKKTWFLIISLLLILVIIISNMQTIFLILKNTVFYTKRYISEYAGQNIDPPKHPFTRESVRVEERHITLKPDFCQKFDGEWVRIAETEVCTNSLGMRDREYSLNKTAGILRVAAVGDSYTFGWGVNLSDSWPKVLEKKLNDKGIKAEVMNFGIPGADLQDMAWIIRKKVVSFNPDIIIVTFAIDDFTNTFEFSELEEKYAAEIQLANPKMDSQYATLLAKKRISELRRSMPGDMDINDMETKLKEGWTIIKNSSQQINATILILVISEYKDQKKAINNVSTEQGMATVRTDLYDQTQYDQEKIWLNMKDWHFNSLGNKIIAEKVYRSIGMQQQPQMNTSNR